jgi:hypothetical protein
MERLLHLPSGEYGQEPAGNTDPAPGLEPVLLLLGRRVDPQRQVAERSIFSRAQDPYESGAAMVTMLDCHPVPSQSSQVMITSRPAPVWSNISSALRATWSFDSTSTDLTR